MSHGVKYYYIVRCGGKGKIGEVMSRHTEYEHALDKQKCYFTICRKAKEYKVQVGDIMEDWQKNELKPIHLMFG